MTVDVRAPTQLVALRRPTAGTDIFSSGVAGDTNDRWVVNADGKLEWGSGAGLDLNLYRGGGGELRTDNTLEAGEDVIARLFSSSRVRLGDEGPAAEAGISFGLAADTVLYRYAASIVATPGTFAASGDVFARLGAAAQVGVGGEGPAGEAGIVFGAAAAEKLYREGPSILRANGYFVADSELYARRGAATEVRIGAAPAGGTGMAVRAGSAAGGTNVGGTLSFGTGAPVNASGANGDIYLRVDGGVLTTIYQRRAGAWVGVV